MMTDDDKVKYHLGVFGQLESIRRPFEPVWDECIEMASPTRGKINSSASSQSLLSPIDKRAIKVYDTTAQRALDTLVDGYQGSVVGRSIDWLNPKISHQINFGRLSMMRQYNGKRLDELPEVREWLQQKKEVYYSAFNYSNFYDTLGPYIRDAATVGHGALYAEKDQKTGKIVFTTIHPREGYLGDNRFDRVDTYYRKFKWTLRKMVEKFGLDKLEETKQGFTQTYEKNPYSEEELYHFTYPRDNIEMYRDEKTGWKPKPYAKNMPWSSLWIWNNKIALESGFNYMPILVWRWDVGTGELYAWCPTSAAIVDILTVNQISKDLLHGTHMATDPMWNIPIEMRKEFRFGPRAFNYYNDPNRIPMQSDYRGNIPIGMKEKEDIKKQVEGHYYKDFFTLLSQIALQGTEMTAYQAQQIVSERALLLGAKVGRFYSEGMDPLIDIVDAIETEEGRMPDPPEILHEFEGMNIDIEYCGPLAQAQTSAQSRPAIAAMESIIPFLNVFPESRVRIDGAEFVAGILGQVQSFPAKAIRTKEQADAIMQAQQQAMQQQVQAQQLTDIAKAAPGLGKPVDSTSILSQLSQGQ
jgi:hypothetical protein